MESKWFRRGIRAGGTLVLTLLAVALASNELSHTLVRGIPGFAVFPQEPSSGQDLLAEASIAGLVIMVACASLFRSRPRRLLDTVFVAQKRILFGMVGLAALGYFDYTLAIPRLTLVLTTTILLVVLPMLFVLIRSRPLGSPSRVLIVGDDRRTMIDILEITDLPVIGYVSPPRQVTQEEPRTDQMTDGGIYDGLSHLDALGGLSRLDEVLVKHDVDTTVLAFSSPDRAEFFGAIDSCYAHGVTAKVHRAHADAVLTRGFGESALVDIDLEPWGTMNHIFKRGFDLAFAGLGLFLLSPIIGAIALMIWTEDRGPILYSQERTASFGGTLKIHKFRTMIENAESDGAQLSGEGCGEPDTRVTRVGQILRRTHLDEIPQLWPILLGRMSVVGPRPERPELDGEMEASVSTWRSRWFVKPGLTGLAQIRGATGHSPHAKLRYDVEYIRRQSFWFDLKIVLRQLHGVIRDLGAVLAR
jgi:lipopolysaccharide/colanic/teichoic acid biosynthesis glycosyltransferase